MYEFYHFKEQHGEAVTLNARLLACLEKVIFLSLIASAVPQMRLNSGLSVANIEKHLLIMKSGFSLTLKTSKHWRL